MRDNIKKYIITFRTGIILLLIFLFFSLTNSNFLTGSNLILILQEASVLGIMGIGMTFVLAIGGIDISVGRNMFLTAAFIAYLINYTSVFSEKFAGSWYGVLLFSVIAVILGAVTGALNGIMVVKGKLQPFIVTLAVGYVVRGLALKLTNSATVNMAAFSSAVNGKAGPIPYLVILFTVLLFLFHILLHYSRFGRHLMAIGNSRDKAKTAGIRVDRNIITAYILCGALAGLGGILSAGQVGAVSSTFGEGKEFAVISATVLGGTSLFGGKANIIPGGILGILLVTTIMNGMAMMNASSYAYSIVRAVIIFIAVMFDSIQYKGELR